MVAPGYLRFPHIAGDLVAFVTADDVWLAPAGGGRAWRFTADQAPVSCPRFTADGTRLAWVSSKDGSPEVYQARVADGDGARLTYWGVQAARVCGWTPAGEVLAISTADQPFRYATWARALSTDASGGPGTDRVLPFGRVSDVSLAVSAAGQASAALLTGTFGTDPAYWKRYRGGTAGRLWVGPGDAAVLAGSETAGSETAGSDTAGSDTAGSETAGAATGSADMAGAGFRRLQADLPGHFDSPMLVGGRLAFLSDHEGTGNVYSCALDGSDLRRHTDHDGWYARHASTDGERVVYISGGEIWLLPSLAASRPQRLEITLGSPAPGRAPRLVTAADHVGSLSVDAAGTASAVEVRGTVHWLTHRDGPARALRVVPGVRARFPQVLGDDGLVVWATDADGVDALEIGGGDPVRSLDPAAEPRRLAAGQVGRVAELAAAPDGSSIAVAALDGRLYVVAAASGDVRELAASGNGRMTGLAWSPDSAWVAWSQPAEHPGGSADRPLRRIRLARLADGVISDVTDGRFIDTDPVFTGDGKQLAFLSYRNFDPVYDAHFFDLSFPYGARPYLLPLQASAPSPFGPQLGGRPVGEAKDAHGAGRDGASHDGAGGEAVGRSQGQDTSKPDGTPGQDADPAKPTVPEVRIDTENMLDRIVAVPVPESRYSRLRAVRGGLAWLREPVTGNLGLGGALLSDDAPRPALERFDFGRREARELADEVDWFEVSKDGTRLVVSDHDDLTVLPAAHKADGENPDDRVRIDRQRARFMADPVMLWQNAYAEAARVVRHEFWVEDLADVDWDAIGEEYRPLLERVSTQSEFTDVLWEVMGELGTSHAYVYSRGDLNGDTSAGLLGADLVRTADGWRVSRVVRGETSDPRARSPLAAPGSGIVSGDLLLAVDGRPVGPEGPGPLLAGTAGKPVELTVASGVGAEPRSAVIVPLGNDKRLRYQDWVNRKRAEVRELGNGLVGYLHVPDMVSQGWADFHRDLRNEMLRDALVVDVRGNGGGHTSELVVEKLARRVIAWDNPRNLMSSTYPGDAPRGPIVALADECAGSDGDIVTAAIRILGLGPVVGARTWGGVVGFDAEHELVDGTLITVPKLAFWMDGFGWGVENHGLDPDVEVIPTPEDWAAGRDVQLQTAVAMALEALRERPAVRPPDVSSRPSRRRPSLPPR